MDKIFIDCNILIDWLTERLPFSYHAEELLSLIELKKVKGYISPLTLSNTYYILRKQTNKKITNEFLNDSKKLFTILDITKEMTISAIDNKFRDFEDDLHYQTAIKNNLDYIVTRNKKDFKTKNINVLTAEEYLNIIKK